MINGILNGLNLFWNTYVISYEGITTILIMFIMILKILINEKASTLNFKKMMISFPSELVFLVMGFLFSDMINNKKIGTSGNSILASIVLALIILVVEYALEKWLDDKLSGKLKIGIITIITCMYLASLIFYICIVFGGVHNG